MPYFLASATLLSRPDLQLMCSVFASVIIASLWQGLALTLLAGAVIRSLPRLSAAARSALWTGALLLAVALPWLLLVRAQGGAARPAVWQAGQRFSYVFVLLWLLASTLRFGQLCAAAFHLRRLIRTATPVAVTADLTALLQSSPRPVQLCTSAGLDRPSVAGFLRPRILLPHDLFAALTENELRQILLHECEHLRRRDDWVNLFGQLSLVLFPLNPALVWLNRQLALHRELACDDRVVRLTGARKTYAACLARVAESSLVHRGLSLAIGILGDWRERRSLGRRQPELARRVERILTAPAATMGRLQSRLATAAVCASLLGGATLLAHSPELISFAPAPKALLAGNAGPAPTMHDQLTPGLQLATTPGSPRLTLTTAVMHAPTPQAMLVSGKAGALRNCRGLTVRKHPRARIAPRVVLTTWHVSQAQEQEPLQEEMVKAQDSTVRMGPILIRWLPISAEDSPIWYTAVPFRDGWMVVQL